MKIFSSYFKIILFVLAAAIILRSLETTKVLINFGNSDSLWSSELLGLILDLCFLCICLTIAFPLYFALNKLSEKITHSAFVLLVCLFFISNFFIIEYFTYQLLPLDIFLYQHSFKEVYHTVETSSINHFLVFSILTSLLLVLLVLQWLLNKRQYPKKVVVIVYELSLLLAGSFLLLQYFAVVQYNSFSLNKPRYFYTQSLSYFLQEQDMGYTTKDAVALEKLYPAKSFINVDYPLMHQFKNDNVLGPFFEKFERAPNIVILIVEGLNDDFIHPYKGVNLMPFLSQLKDKSLYWNKCFTLGERSFAVVPSITGSLPYGEIGFMQSDIIPRHLSLMPILEANQYHTSFFYGQGKWFHNKGRYFELNNTDLIFDNTSFDSTYKKITVGADNFFWGYNDKDLFRQSLEVISRLPSQKRLDIYFTGTSHPPFIIADTNFYEAKFNALIKTLKSEKDVEYFNTYKPYIISELFVNEAIQEFMLQYQKRKEYANTIFIITGDHPMTELPRANPLKKYHVPLIIYSPKLKGSKVFSQTASHLDVYESLLSFLSLYNIKVPSVSTAIGGKLNTTKNFRDDKIAFMNGNREVIDYLSGDYFLSGDQLYKVNADLSLTKSSDKFREALLKKELYTFNKVSLHAYQTDNLLPDSLYCQSLSYHLINSQRLDSLIITGEYYNIIETKIANKESCLEMSLWTPEKIMDGFSVICEARNVSGEVVFWQNYGLNSDNKKYQLHLKIPKQLNADTGLTFKAFFLNSKKQKVKLEHLKVLFYQK